jgi:pimeloyl-ACP methyl ester carboxylesterase
VSNAELWHWEAPTQPTRRLRSIPTVRLSQHRLRLSDGHEVQALVAGRGMPLVVVHGFATEGFLYAQSLSRLVSLGFKVIAIDTAGHGGTAVLSRDGLELAAYSRLLGRAVDELGIRRAVYIGHSMGGRLVTDLAAADPSRAVGLVLVDAIVGEAWDQIVATCRLWPPLLALFGTAALLDAATNVSLDDRRQTAKLASLWARCLWGDMLRPWQLMMPFLSVLRSPGSGPLLETLRAAGVPVTVVHGDADFVVPVSSARDAARRSGGELVILRGAGHSWMLKDPETLPAIVGRLLQGRLGNAYEQALIDAGLDPASATTADIEGAMYEPGALATKLSPDMVFARSDRRATRYEFEVEQPAAG